MVRKGKETKTNFDSSDEDEDEDKKLPKFKDVFAGNERLAELYLQQKSFKAKNLKAKDYHTQDPITKIMYSRQGRNNSEASSSTDPGPAVQQELPQFGVLPQYLPTDRSVVNTNAFKQKVASIVSQINALEASIKAIKLHTYAGDLLDERNKQLDKLDELASKDYKFVPYEHTDHSDFSLKRNGKHVGPDFLRPRTFPHETDSENVVSEELDNLVELDEHSDIPNDLIRLAVNMKLNMRDGKITHSQAGLILANFAKQNGYSSVDLGYAKLQADYLIEYAEVEQEEQEE
jgi:cytochrome c556